MKTLLAFLLAALLPGVACAQPAAARFQNIAMFDSVGIQDIKESHGGVLILLVAEQGDGSTVARIYNRQTRRVHDLGPADLDYAWSPAGDRLAFARLDDPGTSLHIWVLPLDPRTGRPTGPARRISRRAGRGPAFSPDGSRIAFTVLPASDTAGPPRIIEIPANGGEERIVSREAGWTQMLQYAPDGQHLFFRHRYRQQDGQGLASIRKLSLVDGTWQEVARARGYVGLSADRQFMAYRMGPMGDPEFRDLIIARAGNTQVARVPLPAPFTSISWSGHGYRVLLSKAAAIRKVNVVTVATGTPQRFAGSGREHSPAWSPDGARMAMIEHTPEKNRLVLVASSGRRQRTFATVHEPAGGPPIWSPDGRRLLFVSMTGATVTIDLVTRSERVLSNRMMAAVRWRRDALAVHYIAADADRAQWREVDLRSNDRLVRDIPMTPRRTSFTFVGDSAVIQATPEEVVLHPPAGASRVLYARADGEVAEYGGVPVSPDGRWAAVQFSRHDKGAIAHAIHIVPTSAVGARRTLPLPAAQPTNLYWHPDGRTLVLLAIPAPNEPTRAALLPLNGEPIRWLPVTDAAELAIAPGGLLMTFTTVIRNQSWLMETNLQSLIAR